MARKKSATKKAAEAAAKEAFKAAESRKVEPVTKKPIELAEQDEASLSSVSSSSSEEDEEEDDYGELITPDVENGIQEVLRTIRSDPAKLLDPNAKFFDDPEQVTQAAPTKQKPMYLKDYHRINLLSGGYRDEDEGGTNEYGSIDGEKPFAVAQREERDQLLSDIKDAFRDEDPSDSNGGERDDDDDEFLKKKATPSRDQLAKADPTFIQAPLPDPEKNQDEFLNAFIDSQAWIPKKGDKVINLDQIDREDEEDFDDAVEDYERAYNFRFEDEQAAEIVSYARNQASLRRKATNLRKRQREKLTDARESERKDISEQIKKKLTLKMNQVMDRLAKIKEAVGEQVSDETILRVFGDSLLKDDFDDADWDEKMAEIFNEQYYEAEDGKPTWHDDLSEDGREMPQAKVDEMSEDEDQVASETDEPASKKTKKEILKQKKSSKKSKETLRKVAAEIVEANKHAIIDEVEEERGRSKEASEIKFKYREVSPETFGLETRDILLADDKQLNSYIGIKKFAPYRPKELQLKDKRKYAKKKNLKQWRAEVFNNKEGAPLPEGASHENEIWIPIPDSQVKSQKKKGRHN